MLSNEYLLEAEAKQMRLTDADVLYKAEEEALFESEDECCIGGIV